MVFVYPGAAIEADMMSIIDRHIGDKVFSTISEATVRGGDMTSDGFGIRLSELPSDYDEQALANMLRTCTNESPVKVVVFRNGTDQQGSDRKKQPETDWAHLDDDLFIQYADNVCTRAHESRRIRNAVFLDAPTTTNTTASICLLKNPATFAHTETRRQGIDHLTTPQEWLRWSCSTSQHKKRLRQWPTRGSKASRKRFKVSIGWQWFVEWFDFYCRLLLTASTQVSDERKDPHVRPSSAHNSQREPRVSSVSFQSITHLLLLG